MSIKIADMLMAENFEIVEIPVVTDLSDRFETYFGSFQRRKFSACLRWNNETLSWELGFLFLYGEELRVFITCDDEPDDPEVILYFRESELARCNIEIGPFHNKPNCILISEISKDFEKHIFCFRTIYEAYDWVHEIDHDTFPETLEQIIHHRQSSFDEKVNEIANTGYELPLPMRRMLTDFEEDEEKRNILDASALLLNPLFESFNEYFEGLTIGASGNLLVSYVSVNDLFDPDPDLGEWEPKLCLLLNGELRIYTYGCDDPEDAENVIYISGPFADRAFGIAVVPQDGLVSGESYTKEWLSRTFVLKDEALIFRACAPTHALREMWTSALER